MLTLLFRSIALMGRRQAVYLGFIGLSLASVACGVIIGPIMNKRVINAIEFADPTLFSGALVLLLLSTVLFWVVSPVACWMTAWASKKAMFRLRSRFAGHLLRLPGSYHDGHSRGEALSALSNDLECLESIYDGQLYKTLENFCIGTAGLVMLFVIDWRLAIAASILGFGSAWTAERYGAPLGRIGARLQENAGRTTAVFLDILKGIRTVKLFGIGASMSHKLARTTGGECSCQEALAGRKGEMNIIVGVLNGLSTFGILVAGGFMVQRGLADWGAVVAVSGLQMATGDLFSFFPMSLAGMRASLAGTERLLRVLDEPEEALDAGRYEFGASDSREAALELKNVTFGYGSGKPVLNRISFTLIKGELTALAGESGRGKSTLVKLMLGLYMPWEGKITIFGGKRELDLTSWRECIAYVPQEPQLFRGTIAENIACGAVGVGMDESISCGAVEAGMGELMTGGAGEVGMDEIQAAAEAAGIHDFIAILPQGYRTMITEDGGNLSGGQKQRIAIARALMKKADILLLDEPTSAQDGGNEAKLMQTLRRLSENRAVLVVAHRESTLAFADRVISLEQGL